MEKLVVILIIVVCGLWFGRRILRQFQAAGKKGQEMSCDCGCSGCDTTQQTITSECCPTDQTDKKGKK